MSEVIEAKPVANKSTDYGKALSWYLKDPKFSNTLVKISLYILSCVFIFPVFYVVPVLMGFVISLTRKIQQGKYELPEITSDMWKEGALYSLTMFGVGFAVSLVILLVAGIFSVLGLTISSSSNGYTHGSASSLALIPQLLLQAASYVINIATSVWQFLALAIFAKSGNIQSIFMIDNYKKLFANNAISNIFVSLLLYVVVVGALCFVGILLCCVGILPAAAVGYIIMASMVGALNTDGIS